MSIQELESLSRCRMGDIPKSSLAELEDVEIDADLPEAERMLGYLEQIQNPYCFFCGGTPVHIVFVNEEQELSTALVNYFSGLKR